MLISPVLVKSTDSTAVMPRYSWAGTFRKYASNLLYALTLLRRAYRLTRCIHHALHDSKPPSLVVPRWLLALRRLQ